MNTNQMSPVQQAMLNPAPQPSGDESSRDDASAMIRGVVYGLLVSGIIWGLIVLGSIRRDIADLEAEINTLRALRGAPALEVEP